MLLANKAGDECKFWNFKGPHARYSTQSTQSTFH